MSLLPRVSHAQRKLAPPPANQPRPTFVPRANRPPLLAPDEYLPTSRLRGGMKGYGLTVFHGSTIERFDVTILGVVKKANNGRDLILVKLGGPKMRRVTDVIAGMSGSPVYINGKIVGAVAYGAQFTREPIGYLTPIEDMLDAWDTNLPQSSETPETPAGLKPLAAKVTVSGVTGPRLTRVVAELAKLGLEARQGGGQGGAGLKGSPLTPGGAVAMSLATGDLDITAVGTLTYRRGKQVVAFGHPFLGIGPLDAPMFSAYIHDIQPSFSESEKIGSPVKMVGAFSQDRPFSVGGRIGTVPRLIPVTIRVNDRSMGKQRVFRARLLRHPQLTPSLAALAAGTAIAEVHGQPGDAMATVTTEVVADGVGKLRHTTRVFDDTAMDEAAVSDLRQVLSLMSGNPFYPVGVRSVDVTVNIEAGRRTAQVERIFLKQSRFAPGDTVDVGVVLKPYKKPSFVRTLSVKIPANAPSGSLLLTVQGGAASGLSGLVALLSGARAPEYASAGTVEQLLHKWEERERGDQLVARLSLPTGAISVRGERLDGLPTNIEGAMRAAMSRTSGTRVERDEVKVSQVTPYVVSGAQQLAVTVVRPDAPTGGGAPFVPPSNSVPISPSSGASFSPPPGAAFDADVTPGAPSDLSPRTEETQPPVPVRVPAAPPSGPGGATPPASVPAVVPASAPASAPPAAAPANVVPPVGRQPGVWRQASVGDFRAGKMRGVSVSATGEVRIAPSLIKIAESDEPFFWSVCPDGQGGTYAGSGDQGRVYHITPQGERKVLAETGEVSVFALARGADGSLYAGTSPRGRILKIAPDGKVTTLVQTVGKHVLCFALSPDKQTLYAGIGAGSPASAHRLARIGAGDSDNTGRGADTAAYLYAVPLSDPSKARIVYAGNGDSVSAVSVAPDGQVYAGVSPGGLIVKVTPDREAGMVLYDVAETAISGLVARNDGVLYASVAPRPLVYRFAPGEAPRIVYDRAQADGAVGSTSANASAGLAGLVAGESNDLYTASGASLVKLMPGEAGAPDNAETFEAATDVQILGLAPAGDTVLAATGSVGGVYALQRIGDFRGHVEPGGSYESSVFDARAISQWGTLRVSGDKAGTYAAQVETRSGNTPELDTNWSSWARARPASEGSGDTMIASPPARFLQYRVSFRDAATLRSVEAFYLPPNTAPQLSLVAPRGGEVWRATQTVRWSANDADRDTLTYEVNVSGDGGKTWQPLPKPGSIGTSLPAESATRLSVGERVLGKVGQNLTIAGGAPIRVAAPVLTPTATSPARNVPVEVEAELAKHPEISADMKAKILADASATVRTAPLTPEVPTTRDTNATLDTFKLPDGTYLVRVVASDRLANPTGALATERMSGPFRVLNRAPNLTLPAAPTVQPDRTARLEGVAQHPTMGALVRGVQFRVDGGDWTAAQAADGIFDSSRESFLLTTAVLTPGAHTIEVQAQDEAGNLATQKVTVTAR